MRSSLNTTGLNPSMQQFIATPFSLYQGRSPPNANSLMLPYIVFQAEVQKPSGIFKSSPRMNSWLSRNISHAFRVDTGVTGPFLKTSDGLNRLKTVIFTLCRSAILTTTSF